MNEEYKYKIIKKLVETNGNKNNAAAKLNCTVRTINRLIQCYKAKGKAGFSHGNNNRTPAITYPDEIKQQVLKLYATKYEGFNITHFTEFLRQQHALKISNRTILNWLKEVDILSPKAQRATKRALKAKLKSLAKETKGKQLISLNNRIKQLDYANIHPRRSRVKYAGELIQMDASEHLWFGNRKTHLHAAIDDASGTIVAAYFDEQETLHGYYQVMQQILNNYGIPVSIFTDRRTIFEYKRKNNSSYQDNTYTQFAYACKQLGVELDSSSIPQEKGKIERLFGSLQSRLIAELKFYNITNIQQANIFLEQFIKRYNEQFALKNVASAYASSPTLQQINQTLAVIEPRVIDNGHCIKYKNQIYLPTDANGKPQYLRPKTRCLVTKTLDNSLYINANDSLYLAKLIPIRAEYSANFDKEPKSKVKEKKKYIPPMSHPWKYASYMKFLNTQKHHKFGADV